MGEVDDKSLPRVVLLSMTEISSSTATGSLLRDLFANFASNSIFQITATQSEDEVSAQYAHRYTLKPSAARLNLKHRLFGERREMFSAFSDQDTLRSLNAFSPQLVYVRVVEDLFRYAALAKAISSKYHIPIVAHVMDDYEAPLRFSASKFERDVHRRFLRRDLKKLFRESVQNFAISEIMSSEFEQRYGCRFDCAHNGVNVDEWAVSGSNSGTSNIPRQSGTAFRLLMAGSIDKRKDAEVLGRLARVVKELNESGALNCELCLNVPRYYLPAAKALAALHRNVIAQQYVPLHEYKNLLISADCLVLARNSDEVSRAYTELSFHNKLPEYLASGTPILCIGPGWDGSVQFLKQHEAAVVLEDPSNDEIREKIGDMARFPERFERMSERARATAFEHFDLRDIRTRFERSLRNAAFGAQQES